MKLFIVVAIVFGVYSVFGIDFVYSERNLWLELADLKNESRGIIFEQNGFLLKVNGTWVGLAKTHSGLINVPALTYPVIGASLGVLGTILFTGWTNDEQD